MIFRQLFEPISSTYTYLFGCPETRQAVLLDPVLETVERDLGVLQQLGLRLAYTLETHIHADHITSACRLRSLVGSKVAHPALDALACPDTGVSEERPLKVGTSALKPLFTPGHTDTTIATLLLQMGLPPLLVWVPIMAAGATSSITRRCRACRAQSLSPRLGSRMTRFCVPGDARSIAVRRLVSAQCLAVLERRPAQGR